MQTPVFFAEDPRFSFPAIYKQLSQGVGWGRISRWKLVIPPGFGTGALCLPEGDLSPRCLDADMASAGDGGMEAGLEQAILNPDRTEGREAGFLPTTFSKSRS